MSKAGIGQLICVFLLIAFIGVSFFGEGATEKNVAEIGADVTAQMNTEGLKSFDGERLFSQYGLDEDMLDSFVYYGSEDIMDVREIIVIKGKENTDLSAISDLIVKKAEEKYNTYKDYDPVAAALLEKRVIENSKGAIIYIVHDDAAAGLEAFMKSVEA